MITAKIDLPLYEVGATYRQKLIWSSLLPIYELSLEATNIKAVTKTPHNLVTGTLVSLQEVFPAFYNVGNSPITVVDVHTFLIAPSLALPLYVPEKPSFSEVSCQVPIDLSGAAARLTIYNAAGLVITTLTELAGLTLGGTSGAIEIYISDEDTALLPLPGVDERFTYILDILHLNGEVSRLSSGKLQPCNFKKKVSKDIYAVTEDTTYLVITAPQGAPGTPGTSGGSGILSVTYTATADGSQTISLPGIISTIWADVYINGLLQGRSEFTVTGVVVNIPPSLDIRQDDVILILYQ